MKHFQKIYTGVDVKPLLAQLDAHPELWDEINMRRTGTGTPHGAMTDIWVRYRDIEPFRMNYDFTGFNDEHFPVWYRAWEVLPALRPIVFNLMSEVDGEMLGGVMITKIPPGCRIERHVDHGWHVDYYKKFYLSIKSDPGSEFICDYGGDVEALNPRPGDVYMFDNRKPHWVTNASSIDRITLICCIRTDLFQ